MPAPWTVEQVGECYRVSDANGLPLAYVYFEDDHETRRVQMGRMYSHEAWKIAANIAKLPDLLKKDG